MHILREAGEAGMTRSEFTRRTQFMDHRQREGVLRTLTEAHLIEQEARQTREKAASVVQCVSPAARC